MGWNFLRNRRYTKGLGLTIRKRVLLAYLLKDAKDKPTLAARLTQPEVSPKLGKLCRWIFLLNEDCKSVLDLGEDGTEVRVKDGENHYTFSMSLLPGSAEPEFVHDLMPLIDIFHVRSYDFYDVRGGTVVDVGAYIGDTATYFAKKGAALVRAYEPNPVNYKYLLRNIKKNEIEKKVEPHNWGVSRNRDILYVPMDASGAGSVVASKGAISLGISIVRPEAIFDEVDRITLLKMDCKACEEEIIDDCAVELHNKVEHIIVQFRDREGERNSLYVSKLRDNGFRLDTWDRTYGTVYLTNTQLPGQMLRR